VAAGQADRLNVRLQAGDFVRIEVIQAGTDVLVTLYDPLGRVQQEADASNGRHGPETLAIVAEISGNYVVEVKTSNPAGGSYAAWVRQRRRASSADREFCAALNTFNEAEKVQQKRTPASRATAMRLLEQAANYFASAREPYLEAMSHSVTGDLLADSGEIPKALAEHERSLALYTAAQDVAGEALAQNNIGGMLDVLGEPRKAMEFYRLSLALYRKIGDRVYEARALNNMGAIEADFGNWQGAIEDYSEALAISREQNDVRRQGLLLSNLGSAYRRLGDFETALEKYQEALPLRRAARDRRGEAATLSVIGDAWRSLDRTTEAIEQLALALSIYESLGDRRAQAETLSLLGQTRLQAKDLAAARVTTESALELERAVGDRHTTVLAKITLSRILALQGELAESLNLAGQARTESKAMGDRPSEAQALEAMARVEARAAKTAEARGHMEEALRIVEDNRTHADAQELRASFLATQQESYAFYMDLLVRLGEPARALEVNERARARSLIEMLAEAGTDIREGADAKLLAREREITQLLNAKGAKLLPLAGGDSAEATALKNEIRDLEQQGQEVQAAIRKSSPHYAALTQPELLTAARIQGDLLDADTLLLEYSLGETRSYLWAVSKTGLNTWELPARAKIETQVNRVMELLTARSLVKRFETPVERTRRIAQADAELFGASKELSAMILAPAASMLAGKRLAIVPDGVLQRLPFNFLPAPGSSEPLVATHETVTLPSASALAILRRELAGRKQAPKMLAVFADPVFEANDPRFGKSLNAPAVAQALAADASRLLEHVGESTDGAAMKIPRLPYTRQEAEQILGVARGGVNLRALDFEANRTAATSPALGEYRYLHFATHGYLDTQRPSLSALVLSQVDAQRQARDGFLRVNDIYNARLNADLAVLSACQTGLGKEVRGEGTMGLTRAFLYAGVPRVIVSLWNVNDRATAGLMATLYERMLRHGKSPTAALREAQNELRKQKQWQAPYYWAAFVQHGEWR